MVSENGVFVDSLVFPIKEVPKPEIIIKYNNEVVNLKEGISLKGFTTGYLELEIARTDFDMFLPKDARFIFSDARLTLARKSEEVSRRAINYLGKSDLFNLIAQVKPGDRLMVEIPEIIRIDSQNRSYTIAHKSIYTILLHDVVE
ncbi:MAG: hypothetical protein ACI85I_000711 [Arenicella sp.]|jgi:hypothetical protein